MQLHTTVLTSSLSPSPPQGPTKVSNLILQMVTETHAHTHTQKWWVLRQDCFSLDQDICWLVRLLVGNLFATWFICFCVRLLFVPFPFFLVSICTAKEESDGRWQGFRGAHSREREYSGAPALHYCGRRIQSPACGSVKPAASSDYGDVRNR